MMTPEMERIAVAEAQEYLSAYEFLGLVEANEEYEYGLTEDEMREVHEYIATTLAEKLGDK